MPERGIVKCLDCDAVFTAILPNHKVVGRKYFYLPRNNEEINKELSEKLMEHHRVTNGSSPVTQGGHCDFRVFLDNGRLGTIEVHRYAVTYMEVSQELKSLFPEIFGGNIPKDK